MNLSNVDTIKKLYSNSDYKEKTILFKMKKLIIYPALVITALTIVSTTSCKKEDKEKDEDSSTNSNLEYGNVTDQEGNTYKTIEVGNQRWMVENLKTSTYCNGDAILNVTDGDEWGDLNDSSTGAWAYYGNDSQNDNAYGKLYNWYAVEDIRGLCPCGWHVPSKAEWNTLIEHLGGEENAGMKMKSTGTEYWESPNESANNESGFSALPGGYRDWGPGGPFYNIGEEGYWWSSTGDGTGWDGAWAYNLDWFSEDIWPDEWSREHGLSIRCIKD